MSDLYQDVILDRGRHPRHARRPERVDGQADGDNPMCGDRITVFVSRDENGCINDVGFDARGCAIMIASADLMADAVRGRGAAEAGRLFEVVRALSATGDMADADPAVNQLRPLGGVHDYPSRMKCVHLPWTALVTALGCGETVG